MAAHNDQGKNRVFYFFVKNDTFVLLHHFRKKSQKTPRREIEKAKSERNDYLNRNKRAKEKSRAGYKVGIIGTEETVAEYKAGDVKCIGTRADESTIAANLFGILREFDDDQVDYIYSESFDTAGIGSAIMNRLLKAAGHHIEKLV